MDAMSGKTKTDEEEMDFCDEEKKPADTDTADMNDKEEIDFKKPLAMVKSNDEQNLPTISCEEPECEEPALDCPSSEPTNLTASIPYKEPYWSGMATKPYSFDVLKNGSIIDKVNLKEKPFYIFGRLPTCDVTLEHPSLSRYHACIQHCGTTCDRYQQGWYLYDLDSTHGTWINKIQVRPKVYHRIRVGHVIKFGGSSRLFILQGPEEDREEEAELSVAELKLQREKQKKEADLLRQDNLIGNPHEIISQDDGCMWGMDMASAVEESQENPFSQDLDESLYIDDPKKCLKNYFDREGYDAPEYETSAEGSGKFKCCLELPIDDASGRPIIAEATVSGKKKESVEACALEACRILDRHGVLRAATHESRKRKKKNWEENDFYDSDEDTFLDRTGTIEKKREQRMKKAGKLDDKAETYDSLSEKHREILQEMQEIEEKLEKARADAEAAESNDDLDALDAYMNSIKSGMMDTKTRLKLKRRLLELRPQEQRLRKLMNIAKPVSFEYLKPKTEAGTVKVASSENKKPKITLPMFGKMKGLHVPKIPKVFTVDLPENLEKVSDADVEEEEEEEDDDEDDNNEKKMECDVDAEKKSLGSNNGKAKDLSEAGTCKSKDVLPTKCLSSKDSSSSKRVITKKIHLQTSTDYHAHTSEIHKPEKKKSKSFHEVSGDSSCFDADADKVVWLPPSDQTGDGRTSLNEKYGY
ncbi:kanadaptin [Octopus sinensis]|uniref:Kanadaptin n=1 Tax=Octopus sinensis TaxID=2607531 RepID=A0A6P7TIG4_9MOLL|nr:kanadaptin [Octopus sinensis]